MQYLNYLLNPKIIKELYQVYILNHMITTVIKKAKHILVLFFYKSYIMIIVNLISRKDMNSSIVTTIYCIIFKEQIYFKLQMESF